MEHPPFESMYFLLKMVMFQSQMRKNEWYIYLHENTLKYTQFWHGKARPAPLSVSGFGKRGEILHNNRF